MDISGFFREGKNIVIELDDEVDYLIDRQAFQSLERDDAKVILKRLYDKKTFAVDIERIKKAIEKRGITDYDYFDEK